MAPEIMEFNSFFISVSEEEKSETTININTSLNQPLGMLEQSRFDGGHSSISTEMYEKTMPAHGDQMFHRLISTIQKHPGQILRYKLISMIN